MQVVISENNAILRRICNSDIVPAITNYVMKRISEC